MSFFSRYLGYLRPHSLRITGMFLAGLAFVALSGVAYWMAADFVQALFTGAAQVPALPDEPLSFLTLTDYLAHYSAKLVMQDSPLETLKRAILFIVIAFAFKNIALYLQLVLSASVEQRIARRMRDQYVEHLLEQDLAFFHRRQSGDLISAGINDITVLNAGLAESFGKLLRDPLTAILFLLLLLSISWQLTLAAVLIAPITGIVTNLLGSSLKRKSKRTQERVGNVTTRLNEALYGIRIVQAYGGEESEIRRFKVATDEHFRQAIGKERLRRVVSPMREFVGVMVIAVILLVAGGQVLGGQWLVADEFVRFLVLLFGLLTPITSLGEVQARLKVAEGAAERVFDLMDEPFAIRETVGVPVSTVDSFEPRIEFQEVQLSYGGDRGNALSDVNVTIQPGERVILAGRSGSGKSSFLNMLPRFYDPSSGQILLSGKQLADISIDELRSNFGIVTQEIVLFQDSVAGNIAYGQPDATRESIERAARLAKADEFILDLPDGYDTDLGNFGERLSGGQRQRIAIARALLSDPPILLFDEPTSALDGDVAREIEVTLREVSEGKTVLMATHRLEDLHPDDRVLMFAEGKLIADAKHSAMLDSEAGYRILARR
jgi:ABC-type multidrug transport system fused ATPase/permease subunit